MLRSVVLVYCTVVLWQAMAYRGLSRHVDLEALPEPGARFSLQELIGEGTYGEVYSARETVTGESTVYSLVLAKN